MKRALLITTVSGFVPQFELNNVAILQEMGYEVHYASNFHCPHYGFDNHRLEGTGIFCHQIDFVRSPFHILANQAAYWQLVKLLRREFFDLIHCHTPMGGVLGRLAAKSFQKKQKVSIKVFYTAHGFHFFRGAPFWNWLFYYPIERWLAYSTDCLITINEEDYQRAKRFQLRKQMDKPGRVVRVNGVGIVTAEYQNLSKLKKQKGQIEFLSSIRKKIGLKEGMLFLLSVGELNFNKNHKVVIQALAKSRADIFYAICGEGRFHTRLQRMIQHYHLENRVKLLGYQNDILELLKVADVFVLPSLREGLSLSLQEAMASGLPVIASDIRGNRELIDEKEGGWLVKPKDRVGWIQAIDALHSADLEQMGLYNINKIKKYDKTIVIKQMKEIYSSFLKKPEWDNFLCRNGNEKD